VLESQGNAAPKFHWPFRWRVHLSRAALVVERLWAALWPAVAVVGLFLVVSLFGLWQTMPGWLHALGLAGSAALLIWAVLRARHAFALPGPDAGLARLERVNALDHQPLRSLGDKLAGGADDPVTRTLWARHQARLARMMRGLKIGLPRSDLPRLDRWACVPW
jgi:hypothetical protein